MSSAALRNKFPISQEEILVHETTTHRLLWYSTFGGISSLSLRRSNSSMRWQFVDCHSTRLKLRQDLNFPREFIHPWGDNSSTATVLDSSWDKISISQEDLFIHKVTFHRLLRLLWYSIQDEKRSLFPKRIHSSTRWQHVDYHGTRLQEDTRFLFPKMNSSSIRRQLVDYYNTRPIKRQDLYFPRRNHHPRKLRPVDYYSTRLEQDKLSIS